MSFEQVIGQHRAKTILIRALEQNRLSHAYLFSGPAGVGKEAMALELASALFCKAEGERPCGQCSNCRRVRQFQHPDFTFLFPSSAKNVDELREVLDSVVANPYARLKPWASPSISINQIRELRQSAMLKPLEGKRVILIADADKMTNEAANSLLKLLEEPPPFTTLILTASQVNSLLPTILSRCQELRFGPIPDNEIEIALLERQKVDPERARLIARVSQGSYGRAVEWLDESFNERRNEAVEFLRTCLKDPRTQIELVEAYLKQYDKKTIKDMLNLLLIWFRDALLLAQQGDQNLLKLVNFDQLDTLNKFVFAFESIDFDTAFDKIERSIQMIERSIQVNLILLVLMSNLRHALKLKGRTS